MATNCSPLSPDEIKRRLKALDDLEAESASLQQEQEAAKDVMSDAPDFLQIGRDNFGRLISPDSQGLTPEEAAASTVEVGGEPVVIVATDRNGDTVAVRLGDEMEPVRLTQEELDGATEASPEAKAFAEHAFQSGRADEALKTATERVAPKVDVAAEAESARRAAGALDGEGDPGWRSRVKDEFDDEGREVELAERKVRRVEELSRKYGWDEDVIGTLYAVGDERKSRFSKESFNDVASALDGLRQDIVDDLTDNPSKFKATSVRNVFEPGKVMGIESDPFLQGKIKEMADVLEAHVVPVLDTPDNFKRRQKGAHPRSVRDLSSDGRTMMSQEEYLAKIPPSSGTEAVETVAKPVVLLDTTRLAFGSGSKKSGSFLTRLLEATSSETPASASKKRSFIKREAEGVFDGQNVSGLGLEAAQSGEKPYSYHISQVMDEVTPDGSPRVTPAERRVAAEAVARRIVLEEYARAKSLWAMSPDNATPSLILDSMRKSFTLSGAPAEKTWLGPQGDGTYLAPDAGKPEFKIVGAPVIDHASVTSETPKLSDLMFGQEGGGTSPRRAPVRFTVVGEGPDAAKVSSHIIDTYRANRVVNEKAYVQKVSDAQSDVRGSKAVDMALGTYPDSRGPVDRVVLISPGYAEGDVSSLGPTAMQVYNAVSPSNDAQVLINPSGSQLRESLAQLKYDKGEAHPASVMVVVGGSRVGEVNTGHLIDTLNEFMSGNPSTSPSKYGYAQPESAATVRHSIPTKQAVDSYRELVSLRSSDDQAGRDAALKDLVDSVPSEPGVTPVLTLTAKLAESERGFFSKSPSELSAEPLDNVKGVSVVFRGEGAEPVVIAESGVLERRFEAYSNGDSTELSHSRGQEPPFRPVTYEAYRNYEIIRAIEIARRELEARSSGRKFTESVQREIEAEADTYASITAARALGYDEGNFASFMPRNPSKDGSLVMGLAADLRKFVDAEKVDFIRTEAENPLRLGSEEIGNRELQKSDSYEVAAGKVNHLAEAWGKSVLEKLPGLKNSERLDLFNAVKREAFHGAWLDEFIDQHGDLKVKEETSGGKGREKVEVNVFDADKDKMEKAMSAPPSGLRRRKEAKEKAAPPPEAPKLRPTPEHDRAVKFFRQVTGTFEPEAANAKGNDMADFRGLGTVQDAVSSYFGRRDLSSPDPDTARVRGDLSMEEWLRAKVSDYAQTNPSERASIVKAIDDPAQVSSIIAGAGSANGIRVHGLYLRDPFRHQSMRMAEDAAVNSARTHVLNMLHTPGGMSPDEYLARHDVPDFVKPLFRVALDEAKAASESATMTGAYERALTADVGEGMSDSEGGLIKRSANALENAHVDSVLRSPTFVQGLRSLFRKTVSEEDVSRWIREEVAPKSRYVSPVDLPIGTVREALAKESEKQLAALRDFNATKSEPTVEAVTALNASANARRLASEAGQGRNSMIDAMADNQAMFADLDSKPVGSVGRTMGDFLKSQNLDLDPLLGRAFYGGRVDVQPGYLSEGQYRGGDLGKINVSGVMGERLRNEVARAIVDADLAMDRMGLEVGPEVLQMGPEEALQSGVSNEQWLRGRLAYDWIVNGSISSVAKQEIPRVSEGGQAIRDLFESLGHSKTDSEMLAELAEAFSFAESSLDFSGPSLTPDEASAASYAKARGVGEDILSVRRLASKVKEGGELSTRARATGSVSRSLENQIYEHALDRLFTNRKRMKTERREAPSDETVERAKELTEKWVRDANKLLNDGSLTPRDRLSMIAKKMGIKAGGEPTERVKGSDSDWEDYVRENGGEEGFQIKGVLEDDNLTSGEKEDLVGAAIASYGSGIESREGRQLLDYALSPTLAGDVGAAAKNNMVAANLVAMAYRSLGRKLDPKEYGRIVRGDYSTGVVERVGDPNEALISSGILGDSRRSSVRSVAFRPETEPSTSAVERMVEQARSNLRNTPNEANPSAVMAEAERLVAAEKKSNDAVDRRVWNAVAKYQAMTENASPARFVFGSVLGRERGDIDAVQLGGRLMTRDDAKAVGDALGKLDTMKRADETLLQKAEKAAFAIQGSGATHPEIVMEAVEDAVMGNRRYSDAEKRAAVKALRDYSKAYVKAASSESGLMKAIIEHRFGRLRESMR